MKTWFKKTLMLLAFFSISALAGTWINITISSNQITLEDLASSYYGDVKDAHIIYDANTNIIGKDHKLYEGMQLAIPVTDKFRDQPEHLGWR